MNQHCAFNDVRYLWQDGTYPKSVTDFPAYGWIGKGGDTFLIRGSLGTNVTYRVGWNTTTAALDSATEQYWGIPGDPYDSGIPVPPSGTAGHPTQILGENYGSCSLPSAKTQIHGGFGTFVVLDLRGSSYVNVQCLDITDFSGCSTVGSATTPCNKNIGTLSDFAQIGIALNNKTMNDTLSDIHVHGLAANGMWGPTGGGDVFSYLDLIGNSAAGWNADPGDGTTGSGSLLVQNFNISWNGCTEEYPVSHALPYTQCADDNVGGYGDGFGTATVASSPGWQAHFDQGVVSYNTQDGLDALHLTGSGSSMTITRVLAYGNMGQQIKVGGEAGTAENNVIVTNCNALRQALPGTPSGYNAKLSDFCRAADTGVAISVGNGSTTVFDFNTIYSASTTAVEIDCQYGQTCNSTATIKYQNNVFLGFLNNAADGYPSGNGEYSNPIYDTTGSWLLGNPGSQFSNNLTYHANSGWKCPALNETKSICAEPNLADESWHNYAYPDAEPVKKATVLGIGVAVPGVTVDYSGQTRSNPPGLGAYEKLHGAQ